MTPDLKTLRSVAEGAEKEFPGPWRGDRLDGTVKYALLAANGAKVIIGDNGNSDHGPYGIEGDHAEPFLIAFHPAACIALLDQIDALAAALSDIFEAKDSPSFGGPGEYSQGYNEALTDLSNMAHRALAALKDTPNDR